MKATNLGFDLSWAQRLCNDSTLVEDRKTLRKGPENSTFAYMLSGQDEQISYPISCPENRNGENKKRFSDEKRPASCIWTNMHASTHIVNDAHITLRENEIPSQDIVHVSKAMEDREKKILTVPQKCEDTKVYKGEKECETKCVLDHFLDRACNSTCEITDCVAKNGSVIISFMKNNESPSIIAARRGLINNSNICYLNAVMQSLVPVMQLIWDPILLPILKLRKATNYFKTSSESRDRYPSWVAIAEISSLFFDPIPPLSETYFNEKLENSTHPCSYIGGIMTYIFSEWNASDRKHGMQQDASEFLMFVLNQLHQECKWKSHNIDSSRKNVVTDKDGFIEVGKKNRTIQQRAYGEDYDSIIRRIFGGSLQLSSRDRKHLLIRQDTEFFWLLNCVLHSHNKTIEDVLSSAFSIENLPNGICKETLVERLPPVLLIVLKRFSYDRCLKRVIKIGKLINIEEKLAFRRHWCCQHLDEANVNYELKSIVCHNGSSPEAGHYTCAVRWRARKPSKDLEDDRENIEETQSPIYDEWFVYDDSKCGRRNFSAVKKLEGQYILVYARENCELDIDPDTAFADCAR